MMAVTALPSIVGLCRMFSRLFVDSLESLQTNKKAVLARLSSVNGVVVLQSMKYLMERRG